MEKVLVTGSCGFIGHHLVKELVARGYYVIGVDNLSNGVIGHRSLSNEFYQMDVADITPRILTGVKWVFHLAALPRVPFSVQYPRETHEANVNQTLELLLTARDCGVQKVIYSSSSSVYGGGQLPSVETAPTTPLSPYAVQKLAGELYAEVFRTVYDLPTVSLRYFNVYGEEQPADNPYTGVITKYIDFKKQGQALTIFGDGNQSRDFTYVGDVVAANILTAEKGEGVYNVGTGTSYTIRSLAEMFGGNIIHLPERPGDPKASLADSTKLQSIGWKPKMTLPDWIAQLP